MHLKCGILININNGINIPFRWISDNHSGFYVKKKTQNSMINEA